MSPESGHLRWNPVSPDSGDQSGRIWSESRILAIWLDLAREPDLARWQESGYSRFRRNCPDSGLYLEFWLY
jgi:hypothetical protein